ncbi:hypothetical protein D3C80_1267490 [compost metagenome]
MLGNPAQKKEIKTKLFSSRCFALLTIRRAAEISHGLATTAHFFVLSDSSNSFIRSSVGLAVYLEPTDFFISSSLLEIPGVKVKGPSSGDFK